MIDRFFKLNMKQLFILLTSAVLLASCSVNVGDDPIKNPKSGNPEAVNFSIYVNRGLQTKAGWGGVLTLDDLKDGTKANGFGVFAYYGNGALYNETSKPDFMYDQQVTYNTTNNVWGYSPVKYWPNEFGEAASSEAADRLTFFAYAPFADVTPSTGVVTGDATTGIIGMSRNITAGDPVVMYSSSLTPGAGVDLCWGVAADAFTSSVDGDNNSVAAGYPFLNVIKPKTGDHLKFEFNHALAQLNVQIDADIDEVAADGKTKIYVRSVTFNGFSMRGSLNLNSNMTDGPIWYDISGTGKLKREPVTVYDGRTDGMEGVATATDVSEKPADLNPIIVQDKPYGDAQLSAGVTTTAVNLFNNADENAPVMVIPTPGVPMSVTIVYDVETEDGRLAGNLSDGVTHGSSVQNKITKTITTSEGNMILSSGKKYVVKLHLGLTSVKFDADVAVWDNTSYPDPVDVNLPENSGSTAPVGTSGALFSVSDTKQVYIATSNLMWSGTTTGGTYSLMENPWTTIETTGDPLSMPENYGVNATTPVQVSLFGWGTPSQPYLTSDNDSDYASSGFIDWGTMYGDGQWRCLTSAEWLYLLLRNAGGFGKGFGFATVNNVHGLILIPDSFSTPTGLTFTTGLANEFDTNVYSAAEWASMQTAGAVFLPAAGYRDPGSERVVNVGSIIEYWSSISQDDDVADCLFYSNSYGLDIDDENNYRSYGASVRLVYEK